MGIYPVVFLISGHAFPGYWRSDKAWWQMRQFYCKDELENGEAANAALAQQATITQGQGEGWMFAGVDNLKELQRYVALEMLTPFEATYVTRQRGFYEALDQGAENLAPETFDAMIDVQSARGENVTPIPLLTRPI